MNDEINLLRINKKSNNGILIFKIVSYTFFGLSLLLGLIFFYLSKISDPSYVTVQESYVENKIKAQNDKISKLLFIKDRLTKINNILKSRDNFEGYLSTILNGIPSDVSTDSVSVDKKNISASFSSQNLKDINNVSDFLIGLYNKKEIFSNIVISSVLLDSGTGKYSLSISGQIF